jgi:hypothetical protein
MWRRSAVRIDLFSVARGEKHAQFMSYSDRASPAACVVTEHRSQAVVRVESGEPVAAIPPAYCRAILAAAPASPVRASAVAHRDQAADGPADLHAVAPSDGPA